MKDIIAREKSRFPFVYELMVWILYAGVYKYSYYLDQLRTIGDRKTNFPHFQILLYAVALTLYILLFYRWLVQNFLISKKYIWFILLTILFLWLAPRISNWLVNSIFLYFNPHSELTDFYTQQGLTYYLQATRLAGWDLRILFTDVVAFGSVAAIRYGFDNEERKRLLERDNLQLQLESLKAQLNPHFLFNTLNSIYGMSIAGSKETPHFILRLSDMMRYILYDCRQNKVPVERDMEFLLNYFEMEKKRYPNASIHLSVEGHSNSSSIAPLLLIPFAENSFKHGAHRLNDKGFVSGQLLVSDKELVFEIENDVFNTLKENEKYGGVGIENVRRRLALYYPDQHELKITNQQDRYKVELRIWLKQN